MTPRRPVATSPGPAPKKDLAPSELREAIARLSKRRDEVAAFDVQAMREKRPPELDALSTAVTRALGKTFGEGTADFRRFQPAGQLAHRPISISVGHGGNRDRKSVV